MFIYQFESNNKPYNTIPVALEKGRWRSNHYRKIIEVYLYDTEDYKALAELYPGFDFESLTITFFFTDENKLKKYANVTLLAPGGEPRARYACKLKLQATKIELAKELAKYFATSPEQCGHSINTPQSLYYRFVDWCYMYFSANLTSLNVEDQECYISALYDAFKGLSSNHPFIPEEPFYSGQAAFHWKERDESGLLRWDHFLFMDESGQIYHHCDGMGILFDKV